MRALRDMIANGMKVRRVRRLRMTRKVAEEIIAVAWDIWLDWPQSFEDLCTLMADHLRWVAGDDDDPDPVVIQPAYGFGFYDDPVKWVSREGEAGDINPDTMRVLDHLIAINDSGFLTVDSQDGEFAKGDGSKKTDKPWEYEQRAYISGFMRPGGGQYLKKHLPKGLHVIWGPSDGKRVTKRNLRLVVTRSRSMTGARRWKRETGGYLTLPVGRAYEFKERIADEAYEDLLHNTEEVQLHDEEWRRQGYLFESVHKILAE